MDHPHAAAVVKISVLQLEVEAIELVQQQLVLLWLLQTIPAAYNNFLHINTDNTSQFK